MEGELVQSVAATLVFVTGFNPGIVLRLSDQVLFCAVVFLFRATTRAAYCTWKRSPLYFPLGTWQVSLRHVTHMCRQLIQVACWTGLVKLPNHSR